MNIEIEAVSPVHIGNGNEISPMEYWLQDAFFRLDLENLIKDEDFEPHLDAFVQGAAETRYIGRYVPSDLLSKHIAYWVPMDPDARSHLASNPIVVKEFVKSAGRVYIPGSSIKGAVFSALCHHVLCDRFQKAGQRETILDCLKNPTDKETYPKFLKFVFDAYRDPEESQGQKGRFFSWIDVEDTTLGSPSEMLKVHLTHVAGAKGARALPIVCETVTPGTRVQLTIQKKPGFRWTLEELFDFSDAFYRRVWEKMCPKKEAPKGGTLLRLGQGSSAWATSLLLFKESAGIGSDAYRVKPPRTQKALAGGGNLGWVLLRVVPERPVRRFPTASPKPDWEKVGAVEKEMPEKPQTVRVATAVKSKAQETTWWKSAALTWNPGKQELTALHEGKKAFCQGKEKIPDGLHARLFIKRKAVTADVEVEPVGNAFRIVSVIEK
ncbi:MAG: type III-A CRISPR-associated RAMP protein Csm5 [Deltaproteobacteria bacterium]|nr:type III-A CRISPR-associated RAMP protein Csm5 [Deltaproteobacteria bacterium]